ncbi:hypothetical protein KB559_10895 [Paenibacillus sp. Marseille-P2973]|uniref:hypothetical protein n=1 Tax=Paenibacillus sp. Marseille-P2973 TaxID=1871032 RepID=UPI001B369423|nr:hypothetical protein [Paenibacillus sp. Marseille-P2973]MBQ4899344.1 hypothetical protein [Paenibacillus sp. Marseille-P2973]
MIKENGALLKVYFDWRALADYSQKGYGDARLNPCLEDHPDPSMRCNIELYVPVSNIDLEYHSSASRVNRVKREEFIRVINK